MTYPLNPVGQPDLASSVHAVIPDAASIRIGRVTRYIDGYITVAISGSDTLVDAAYLTSYEPVLGDLVVALKQGNQWVVLGSQAAIPPDNLVANPSFEVDPDGTTPPTDWSIYHGTAGEGATTNATVTVETQFGSLMIDGRKILQVLLGIAGVSITYVSSAPIAVTPGELVTASSYWSSLIINGGAQPADAELLLTWYGNETDTYPTTVAANTSIAKLSTPQGDSARWYLLRPVFGSRGTEVPAGATHMRVTLRTVLRDGDSLVWWDRITAQRMS